MSEPKPKQTPTQRDDEMVVLASMIAKETNQAATKIILAAKLRPGRMFTDPEMRDNYEALKKYGPGIFDGYLCQIPIAELATPFIEPHVGRIVRAYKQHLAETDRTLDTFETPGPDKDDPDCLFQNRWLRRGACGAIVSTSGVGKSSFSMQAAALWAGGQECLGVRPLKPLRIGIFQSEDDEYDVANFRDRIRIGLAKDTGWTPEQIQEAESRVTFCALDGSTGARFVEHIRRKQTLHHFDLIIINPLFAFFGGDMNDGNAMTAFLRHGIDPLIKAEETKCACIIIHHTGKPNKEAMSQGDIFKAYLGSGSGEFTNYIRSALVITPWNNGKISGVFDLIGAKHGDKLGWKDADGKPTTKKTVCYANRIAEYADTGMIFWVEPDEAQFAELKKSAAPQTPTAAPQGDPNERCAQILAEHIRKAWTATTKPYGADDGQREWVQRINNTGFTRATRAKVYDLMAKEPYRWNLRLIRPNNRGKGYLIGTAGGDNMGDNINPEQENLV